MEIQQTTTNKQREFRLSVRAGEGVREFRFSACAGEGLREFRFSARERARKLDLVPVPRKAWRNLDLPRASAR